MSVKLTASALAIAAVAATSAAARDQVQVAGSSTVLPYVPSLLKRSAKTPTSQHQLLNPVDLPLV